MPSRLYVSDLDGTLLQPNGRLSDFAIENLGELTRRGVAFTVASGRSYASIRHALGPLKLSLPVISSDGALISAFDDPTPLHLFSMDVETLSELEAELREQGYNPLLDQWTGTENVTVGDPPQNPVERWYLDVKKREDHYRWNPARQGDESHTAQTISVTLLDRPEWLEELRDDLDDRYGSWFKTDYLVLKDLDDAAVLWVQHRDARKERALAVLGAMLDVPESEIVVFGDELNDLGMFLRECHGVAVENAHPEVKACAREVIGPHHDDSVVKYLLRSCS